MRREDEQEKLKEQRTRVRSHPHINFNLLRTFFVDIDGREEVMSTLAPIYLKVMCQTGSCSQQLVCQLLKVRQPHFPPAVEYPVPSVLQSLSLFTRAGKKINELIFFEFGLHWYTLLQEIV